MFAIAADMCIVVIGYIPAALVFSSLERKRTLILTVISFDEAKLHFKNVIHTMIAIKLYWFEALEKRRMSGALNILNNISNIYIAMWPTVDGYNVVLTPL